jgi:hypothetical protein
MVMFDEPMIGLDPKAIKELKNIFVELKNAGCAVLISTHIIDSIDEVWDKVLIMSKGEIVLIRTRDELTQAGNPLSSYSSRSLTARRRRVHEFSAFSPQKDSQEPCKSIFKKPAVLIGYILVAIFLGAMIVLSFVMPSGLVRQSSSELFRGIMMIVFIFLYYTTLKLGIEKGSSYFRAADVNLIFTAPISPNKVLLYGFIKQIAGTFALLFIAIFQIPNLKNNFVMMPYGVPMLMLSVVAYAMAYPLMGMVIYSFTSKSKKRKLVVKRILMAVP